MSQRSDAPVTAIPTLTFHIFKLSHWEESRNKCHSWHMTTSASFLIHLALNESEKEEIVE